MKVIRNGVRLNKIRIGTRINSYLSEKFRKTRGNSGFSSYQVDDFVNIKNPQSLSSGKSFAGDVTLGDLKFIGPTANINDKKIASLQNCWIDTSSSNPNEFIDVTKRVTFQNLVTPGFQANKIGKKFSK